MVPVEQVITQRSKVSDFSVANSYSSRPSAKQAKNTSPANVSRRDFLRRATLLGAGFLAHTQFAPALYASENTPSAAKVAPQTPSPYGTSRQGLIQTMAHVEAHVYVNQVGYLPNEFKRAVIPAYGPISGNGFSIVDEDALPKVRYQGSLRAYENPSGRPYGLYSHHFIADFDDFTRPGRYRVRLSNGTLSVPFSINKDLYGRLIPLTLSYFATQQCGAACADWHEDCHPDDGTIVGGPRNGQSLNASGGWHDAGDYLKFVETASYVTAVMLFTCDNFPHLNRKPRPLDPGVVPPVLAQARVGLEWLLKMHPAPDEFYFQVGDASDHDTWRLPEQDCMARTTAWKPRLVHFGVGANLAGRTAAAFAMASRLFAPYDQPFAHRCYEAAQTVYQLGLKNPVVKTTLPADFYPEKTWEDDMAWGAVELFRATGQRNYLEQALQFAHSAGAANEATSVYNTHALAHYTLYRFAVGMDRERLREYLRTDADYARLRSENPYGLATPYIWGTAEAAAGAALNCLLYSRLLDNGSHSAEKTVYTVVARQQRDFILGCNPFNQSYLIGAGTRYPQFPHHQIADIKKAELTGALVGGPASMDVFKQQKIELGNYRDVHTQSSSSPSADIADEVAVYHDVVQDYVTNEPAIDYTAKFLLLAAFYDHPV